MTYFKEHILRFLYKNNYEEMIFECAQNTGKLDKHMDSSEKVEGLIKPFFYNKDNKRFVKIKGCNDKEFIPNNLYEFTLRSRKWRIKNRKGYVLDMIQFDNVELDLNDSESL